MDARLVRNTLGIVFLMAASASASEFALTAFEPFGGTAVNNSAEVVRRLAVRLRESSPAARVTECVLPVEYDRGARIALECIGENRPDLVLSFGTGGCSLDFETRARNRDDTSTPDNAGVLRNRNTPIIRGAPEYLAFDAPMDLLYLRAPRDRGFVIYSSDDAGAYVCNNTAYWLAHAFTAPDSPTRYGFIHVPPTYCGSDANPDALADTIYRAVRAAMPELF